jgi:ubiquitin C-terminal hydrolase
MVQNYLKENGFENNFINLYSNISKLEPKNEEEKNIIKYFQTKMDNYQPNIMNGLVILNTQIPSLGLQNVGATCYMNSTLQCLIHVKELSEILLSAFYLKYPLGDSNLYEKHKLTAEYVNILKNVFFPKFYGNESPCFAPYKFKELVGELNPLFSGIAANDAKDLLQFILERMHSELKMAMQYFSDYNIDQTNELQSKQYFYQSYVFQNNSPFLSYLFGIIKIQTKCLKCNIIKYNFQSYNLLYFPLKESKKFAIVKKKEENKDFNEDNYILNLEDCFMYNEKVEYFTGDNSMYCNICNSLQDANYQSMLYFTPPVLAIVLNRGRANADFKEKFNFSTELDIVKYLHNDEKKGKYYLISMVVHFGESSMSGHFMAYCRMDKDSKWFCYNDAYVSECKDFEDIIKRGTPYILFYHQE